MPRVKNASLVEIHLRLRRKDVAQARREALRQAIPYQHVIRAWVATGAERSVQEDKRG